MLFLDPELEMPSRRLGPLRSIMFDTATTPALEARVAASALGLRFGVEDANPERGLEFPRLSLDRSIFRAEFWHSHQMA